jgi:ADP-heptose:LPS heptosyltransferase
MVRRIEGIGDLLYTTPVILALRERCPDARSDALVNAPHSS